MILGSFFFCQCTDDKAEKREEVLKRGKADFYTTDAMFDERFKLGYGMTDSQVGDHGIKVQVRTFSP